MPAASFTSARLLLRPCATLFTSRWVLQALWALQKLWPSPAPQLACPRRHANCCEIATEGPSNAQRRLQEPRQSLAKRAGMAMVRKRIRVTGCVQGVGFRFAAAERARALGLGGYVRNRPDGTVEAAAEGEADDVAAFVAWCGHGPAGARVVRVEEADEPPAGAREFRIEQ